MKKFFLGTLFLTSIFVFLGLKINQADAKDRRWSGNAVHVNIDPKRSPEGVQGHIRPNPTPAHPNQWTMYEILVQSRDSNGNLIYTYEKIGNHNYIPDQYGDDVTLGGPADDRNMTNFYNGSVLTKPSDHGIAPVGGEAVYFYDGTFNTPGDGTPPNPGDKAVEVVNAGGGVDNTGDIGATGFATSGDIAGISGYQGDPSGYDNGGFSGGYTGGDSGTDATTSNACLIDPMSCTAIAYIPFTSSKIEISNPTPVPQTSAYNFSPNLNLYPTVPVKDPMVLAPHLNPYDGSHGNTNGFENIGITKYNTVIAPVVNNNGSVPFIHWPAGGLFANSTFWNNPLSYTFQSFRDFSTTVLTNLANWYPLNFFTVPDPTAKIPTLPTVPVTISWAPVSGAAKYRFTLQLTNPLGTTVQPGYTEFTNPDPAPIVTLIPTLPLTPPFTVLPPTGSVYQFLGHPSSVYNWSAVPINPDGTDLLGPVIYAGNSGYSSNPFWRQTATAINVQNSIPVPNVCYTAGVTYYTNGNFDLCNPYYGVPPGGTIVNNGDGTISLSSTTGTLTHLNAIQSDMYLAFSTASVVANTLPYDIGGRSGREFIDWKRIPGAVRYEIQYFVGPTDMAAGSSITPDSSYDSFTDNTPFTASYTAWVNGQEVPKTGSFISYTMGSANCTNCGLNDSWNTSDDLDPVRPNFQYNFGGFPPGGSTGGGIFWRVRGIDSDGSVIRGNLIQSGAGTVPLPNTPYQSAYLNWPKISGATSYVVDVAEKASDLDKLPALTATSAPLSQATLLSSKVNSGLVTTSSTGGAKSLSNASKISSNLDSTTQTPQSTETTPDASKVFLLRTVIPDLQNNAGEATTLHFKKLLDASRVYIGKVNRSAGLWDYDGGLNDQLAFDEQVKSDTFNFTTFPDNYYPFITDDLSLGTGATATIKTKKDKSTLASNQLEITSYFPITVKDLSAGDAKITTTQTHGANTPLSPSTYWVRTIITFGSKKSATSQVTGNYAFSITKKPTTFSCGGSGNCVVHPLTYSTFGPMPMIVGQNGLNNLTNKAYTEFDKLSPGQTYYWRVRALKDPQISNPSSTAAISFPGTWSAVGSFTTPTGTPTSINVGSKIKFQDLFAGEPVLNGTIADISQPLNAKNLSLGKTPMVVEQPQPISSKNLNLTPISALKLPVSKSLTWNATPTATSYNIEVYSTSDTTKAPFKVLTGITTTSAELQNLIPGTKYYFIVRAVNAFGIGPKNPVYSFVAAATTAAPAVAR